MSDDLRAELAAIVASTRALVEWHEMTGSTGLVRNGAASAEAHPAPVALHEPARAPANDARRIDPKPIEAKQSESPRASLASPAKLTVPSPPASPVASVASASNDDRTIRLALLAEKTRGCELCVLCKKRKQAVFARGNPFAELCFVGEGPGADEDAQGEPFVGKAGQLLDRMIVAMGYTRDDVYVCNIVKCRPPDNRKPEPDEMAACIPYLHEQLALVQPRALVALGATAMQGLTGTSEGITRLRGKWRLYKGTIPVMPTFHPAYLLRQPAAKREVWGDLQDVMRLLGKTPAPRSS